MNPPTAVAAPASERAPARPVRLLPRHWAWLAAQPRSADASLRQLVEDACRDVDGRYRRRAARDACYTLMRDLAGDRPGFEEAVRALYAGHVAAFAQCIAGWPADVRASVGTLAAAAWPTASSADAERA